MKDNRRATNDYVAKLEGRIRELAIRLHELENEKLKMKRDLSIPKKDSTTEINSLKEMIEKLNNENKQLKTLYLNRNKSTQGPLPDSGKDSQARILSLQKEKATIEESLRHEVLDNEEKRNYIEILKEALEAKINELGLKELLEKLVEEGANIDDVFTQLVATKKEVNEKIDELTKVEGTMKDMEETIVNLKSQIDEERNQLIDCHNKIERAGKENEELNNKIQDLIQKVISVIKDSWIKCKLTMMPY